MLRYIIGALLAFTLIALLVIWIVSGGPRKIITDTKMSFIAATPGGGGFRLPWQPAQLFPTLDITKALDLTDDGSSYDGPVDPGQQLQDLEAQYDQLNKAASDMRSFGTPSPYAGKITIVQDASGVRESETRDEYIEISANYSNTAPVSIESWMLESALSGARVRIPPVASPFIANVPNQVRGAELEPGGLAIVSSGFSPVGISFRENICSGYLEQFQSFSPPLSEECPSPSDVLPLTAENLQRYGDTCFDALNTTDVCRFPQNLPANISPSCRSYLTSNLSYDGCVSANRYRTAFQKNMWRIFLGSPAELWRNSHDAIRLLDAQGRTVSVFVY